MKNKFEFQLDFENVLQLVDYILEGCETVEEAREKLALLSGSARQETKEERTRRKTRERVKKYRERQKAKNIDQKNT